MPSWPRRFCCDEDLALIGYDGRDAAKDLVAWRTRGPRPTTQELIDAIRAQGVEGALVLDVGAGVGAVHTALLEAGAASAIDVDASREYLAAARAEAERRGLVGRVTYRYGDLVELAADVPPTDIVTLDSVVCCYPYLPALMAAVVTGSPRLVGLTYPRDAGWMLAFMRLFNLIQGFRGSPARYFAHRHSQLRGLMAAAGYTETYDGGSPGWRVVVYRRDPGRRADAAAPVGSAHNAAGPVVCEWQTEAATDSRMRHGAAPHWYRHLPLHRYRRFDAATQRGR